MNLCGTIFSTAGPEGASIFDFKLILPGRRKIFGIVGHVTCDGLLTLPFDAGRKGKKGGKRDTQGLAGSRCVPPLSRPERLTLRRCQKRGGKGGEGGPECM